MKWIFKNYSDFIFPLITTSYHVLLWVMWEQNVLYINRNRLIKEINLDSTNRRIKTDSDKIK